MCIQFEQRGNPCSLGGKLQETDKLKTPEIIIHSLGNYLKMRFSQILFCAYMNLQNWCHTLFFFFFFQLCQVFMAASRDFSSQSKGYSSCGALAFHYGGFSCCRSQALGARAWQLWLTSVALRHVGPSWTKYQTAVLCIGQVILIHSTTREVLFSLFIFCFWLSHMTYRSYFPNQ